MKDDFYKRDDMKILASGWAIYILALVAGLKFNQLEVMLILLVFSFTLIIKSTIWLNQPHIKKGFMMLLNGVAFSTILAVFVAEQKTDVQISELLDPSYKLIILLSSTAFGGAAGGLIASEAMKYTPDKHEKAVYQSSVDVSNLEKKVQMLSISLAVLSLLVVSGFGVIIYLLTR
ncbi:hypothetical protein C9J01_08090 [Photobacterium rosenbergii]|uniref:Uncharacterized protein n=1 Tax=Photobacterium rosenbergii TaxID=294936 RepID=A0A2T3NHA2_9GAMM|nr:hypothetical protein [Photobacterium rosenbergii]PSW14388.1 hypothetical protein C9J01_08090 [Photobacterium rosenbergii]